MNEFKIIKKYFKKLSLNQQGAYGLSDDISVINLEKNEVIKSLAVGRVPYKVLIDYIE